MEGRVTFYDDGRQPTVMFRCAGCGVSDRQTISRMKAAMFIAELPEINCANCDLLQIESGDTRCPYCGTVDCPDPVSCEHTARAEEWDRTGGEMP